MGTHGGRALPAVYVIEVVIGIGLLIFIHELGHFVAAKLSKVRVERFSLGFGPELVGVTRGDTRYSIRVIPLGGYVKMLGDEPGSDEAEASGSFLAQPFRKKAFIILAGASMNIVLALVMFVAVFQIGIQFPAAHVGSVEYGSPAWYAGIEVGDRVVEINGARRIDFLTLATDAALTDQGTPMHLVVERDGREMPFTVYPALAPSAGMSFIGVERWPTLTVQDLPALDGEENPAAKAGLATGMTVVAINGETIESYFDLERRLSANGMKAFTLAARTSRGDSREFTIQPIRPPQPIMGIAPFATTEVTAVERGSLAEEMGLQAGDLITAVGDVAVSTMPEVREQITEHYKGLGPLKIERDGKTLELPWPRKPASAYGFIGAASLSVRILPKAARVEPDTPAAVMGLEAGDVIASIDGHEVKTWDDISRLLRESTGTSVAVSWTRDGRAMSGSFEPAYVGIGPGQEMVLRRLGLVASFRTGFKKAWEFASQIYILLRKAFGGQSGIARNLRGPVGIVQSSYQVAEHGVTQLIFFLAIIGVNLGVVNLLPIPILDGGLLAMFVIEKIKGKPLSITTQAVLQYIGLALIVALFLYVTFNDVLRLITG